MKVLVQIVKNAQLDVGANNISSIDYGFVLYVGFCTHDTIGKITKMALKISKLRIFEDEQGKTNLSIFDVNGEVLSVSQFTLYANCEGSNRPSFSNCLNSEQAQSYYHKFNEELRKIGLTVKEGVFGETMVIKQTNYGPFSLLLEV